MTIYQKLRIVGAVGFTLQLIFCFYALATKWAPWKLGVFMICYLLFLIGWTANKIEEGKKLKDYK